jgi:regulatory protein
MRRGAAEPSADPEACREAALRLLERTRRTRSDLARRLRDKGFTSDAVAGVLERLARVGLVDDVEYARAFLAGRWGRRAAGWRRLAQDLRRRGIADEDIQTARGRLETLQGPADEVALARRVIEQSATRYARLDPYDRRRRLWAMLVRRGFATEIIEQAIAAVAAAERSG